MDCLSDRYWVSGIGPDAVALCSLDLHNGSSPNPPVKHSFYVPLPPKCLPDVAARQLRHSAITHELRQGRSHHRSATPLARLPRTSVLDHSTITYELLVEAVTAWGLLA